MTRAQTTIDYAIGVSVFLIVVAFVFTMVPNLFAPYQSGIQSGQPVHAERVAGSAYDELTYDNGTLNELAKTSFFASSHNESFLRNRFGVDARTDVNVTMTHHGNVIERIGPRPRGAFTTATRVVVGDNSCRDGCKVVIRLW